MLVARYIASNGDPAQAANQPWDDSVKSLAHYPDVLKWMDQNLEWTTAVGEAFLDQPADVMNSIQGLRAEAKAAGNLTDTPHQRVIQEESGIRIVPAQPDVIYVPQYDPDVVYVRPYSQNVGPLLTFGTGFAVAHGSTTIAIGAAAVFMWVSGVQDGTITEIGIAGTRAKTGIMGTENWIAGTKAETTTASMS